MIYGRTVLNLIDNTTGAYHLIMPWPSSMPLPREGDRIFHNASAGEGDEDNDDVTFVFLVRCIEWVIGFDLEIEAVNVRVEEAD